MDHIETKKTKGRPPITGRFLSRTELELFILHEYHATKRRTSDIARHARVSPAVVNRVINAR